MGVFEYMQKYGHEQILFCYDKVSGLKAIIGVHDTTLGPALGGCRMWPYEKEEDALLDVVRLSRGMTYKNSAMGLNLGGGKCVVLGNSRTDKSEELFRALGKFVQSLHGRYITAEDVGINVEDINLVSQETRFVAGRVDISGDPSPATAYGVYRGMKACAKQVWGDESLKGRTVAVQGLGHVGFYLCKHLADEGAKLIVTDIFPEPLERAVKQFGATAVKPEEIYGVAADIYAPCALGATVNDETIPQLQVKIVAGSANNQLQEPRHADRLAARGILYAPDFIINGGGVVNVAEELNPSGYNRDRSYAKIGQIYDKLLQIFKLAETQSISTAQAAELVAEQRINKLHGLKRMYITE